jgi:hypothetical protein
MFGVWFDAENLTYPANAPPPNATIHTLAELPEVLGL